jgi:membrane dipeptidase
LKIIDTHSDVLSKMWKQSGALSFHNSPELQANLTRLQEGQVSVQCLAIFVNPSIKTDAFQAALEQIDIFRTEILEQNPLAKHITSWDQLSQLNSNEIGFILTLEGADVIGNDLTRLKTLYQIGIKSIGLTWNFANLCADGVLEKRGAGLSLFGEEVVKLNNKHLVWTDVSHLCEKAFWDVMEIADFPIASHSNAKSICDNVRNLSDEQAAALFQNNGFTGIVYAPDFLSRHEMVTFSEMVKHIDHFCSLGGVKHICLGSDFDGITDFVQNLENASKHQNLINELLKYYKEEDVQGFAYQNFLDHVPKQLSVKGLWKGRTA